MKTTTIFAILTLAFCCSSTVNAVIFDWATVGNPGNAPDDTGYGAVDYTYRISKHEVTNAQYAEFLNAVDPTGTNPDLNGDDAFLYHPFMSSDARGGINLNGLAAIGSKYEVKSGRNNNPVVFISFFDAMRFVNWLENGQGGGSTESGVYTIGNGLNESRNPGASYFIPSESEWYKAAFHKNDGVTGNYWDYPTATNAVPFSDQPPGSSAPTQSNTANFFRIDNVANGYDDGYAVSGSPFFNNAQNYLTDVGVYDMSQSPYGTFDQGGNVWEWNESVIDLTFRGVRAGDWNSNPVSLLSAEFRGFGIPTIVTDFSTGFRVASIPEPTTCTLALAAVGYGLRRRRHG